MDWLLRMMFPDKAEAMQRWGINPFARQYSVYGTVMGAQLVAAGQRMVITLSGGLTIEQVTPRGSIEFGGHRSHYQPRDPRGRFVSYRAAGLALELYARTLGSSVSLEGGNGGLVQP